MGKTPLMFSSYDQVNRDTCKLVNTGNTLTLSLTTTPSPHPTMSGGPFNTTSYHFSQVIFHWGSNDSLGSEHTIRTNTYPMEVQLIHKTSSQGETKLAIASFLFEISQHDNPFLAPIIDTLGNIQVVGSEVDLTTAVSATRSLAAASKDTELDAAASKDAELDAAASKDTELDNTEAMDSFSMEQLMQDSISGPYFAYKGSLTSPPCTQVEQVVVFRIPLDISSTQLEQFRKIQQVDGSSMVDNFRPVQQLGKRVLAFTM